jgi:hypothetical protein
VRGERRAREAAVLDGRDERFDLRELVHGDTILQVSNQLSTRPLIAPPMQV